MKQISSIVTLVLLLLVPHVFGGTAINITSANVTSDTVTIKGSNLDLAGDALQVTIGGYFLTDCNVTSTELTCPLAQALSAGTYVLAVSGGNAPALNDEIDVFVQNEASATCLSGLIANCYSGDASTLGVGPCTTGTSMCVGGTWGSCQGEVTPTTEICGDGVDNNCDGILDNGCAICGNGVVEPGEVCDDGDDTDAGPCNADCSGIGTDGCILDSDCGDILCAHCDTGTFECHYEGSDFVCSVDPVVHCDGLGYCSVP